MEWEKLKWKPNIIPNTVECSFASSQTECNQLFHEFDFSQVRKYLSNSCTFSVRQNKTFFL